MKKKQSVFLFTWSVLRGSKALLGTLLVYGKEGDLVSV